MTVYLYPTYADWPRAEIGQPWRDSRTPYFIVWYIQWGGPCEFLPNVTPPFWLYTHLTTRATQRWNPGLGHMAGQIKYRMHVIEMLYGGDECPFYANGRVTLSNAYQVRVEPYVGPGRTRARIWFLCDDFQSVERQCPNGSVVPLLTSDLVYCGTTYARTNWKYNRICPFNSPPVVGRTLSGYENPQTLVGPHLW